jgi:hypothetical protein
MIHTRYMSLMMKDPTHTWIFGLPANTIHSWKNKRVFVGNYKPLITLAYFECCVLT